LTEREEMKMTARKANNLVSTFNGFGKNDNMKKYSKVYLVKGEKYYGYRYNFDDCVLEYVEKVSDKFDGESDITHIRQLSFVLFCFLTYR
jgi:hypothetical protein